MISIQEQTAIFETKFSGLFSILEEKIYAVGTYVIKDRVVHDRTEAKHRSRLDRELNILSAVKSGKETPRDQAKLNILVSDAFSDSGTRNETFHDTMSTHKLLVNYTIKRIELFKFAESMKPDDWHKCNEYLNEIEERIIELMSTKSDHLCFFIREIERNIKMVYSFVQVKIKYFVSVAKRLAKKLFQSSKGIEEKPVYIVIEEQPNKIKPLSFEEWRRLEDAMTLKHKDSIYRARKLLDIRRIEEKDPEKVRIMLAKMVTNERQNAPSS